ncbi:MAG: hypothetical protein ABJF88_17205 [Rhodothermales bacterium]
MAALNIIEFFEHLKVRNKGLIILAPLKERKEEMKRVMDVYHPKCKVKWIDRVRWSEITPRIIRGPVYRLENWIWAAQALLIEPRVLLGTDIVAPTLWPGRFQQRFARLLPSMEIVAVDEGVTTLSVSRRHTNLLWFTAYDIEPEKIWHKNNYTVTRELIKGVGATDQSWFVGQPRGVGRQLSLEDYVAIVSLAVARYGVTHYFPHPAEEEETLEAVSALGISIQRPAAPLELLPMDRGVPKRIVGISSAAVVNFKILYGDSLECVTIGPRSFTEGQLGSWYKSAAVMGVDVVPFAVTHKIVGGE